VLPQSVRPAASAKDYASIARDIVPSGQYGSVPAPPQATVQAQMYNALTPLFNHVTQSDLLADFKPDPLGTASPGPTTNDPVPRAGVTIVRDRYDVPHIFGKTRDDVTWVRYCGGGSIKRCRAQLWAAMDKAGRELAAKQGPNPSAWHSSATAEQISFIPGLLPFKMSYTNRPTGIQQVLSFFGHAPQDTGR
jgi:hypothetical protein